VIFVSSKQLLAVIVEEKMCKKTIRSLLMLLTLASMLPGCGGGGGDSCDGCTEPTASQELTISTSQKSALSLENVVLALQNSDASSSYKVQIDLSGTAQYLQKDTVSSDSLFNGSDLLTTMPMLELADIRSSKTVSLRIIDTVTFKKSNSIDITVNTLSIPDSKRGTPSTVLDMFLKAVYMNSGSSYLLTDANAIQPEKLYDSLVSLNQDTSLMDKQAEYILRSAFGYSAIDPIFNKRTRLLAKQTETSGDTSARLRIPFGEEVLSAYQTFFDCLEDSINSTNSSDADNAFGCGVNAVQNEIIPSLGNLQGGIVSVTNRISSMLRLGGIKVSSGYIDNMSVSATLTHFVAKMAKLGLGMETSNNPGTVLGDFVQGELTNKGLDKAYNAITSDFSLLDKEILKQINARGILNDIVNLSAEGFNALRNIENDSLGFISDIENLESLPSLYGSILSNDNQQVITNPYVGQIDVSQFDDPYDICNDPGFAQGLTSIGQTCREFLAPFLDQEYFETVLQPVINDFLANVDPDYLLNCIETDPTFSSTFCSNLISNVSFYAGAISDAIDGYTIRDFRCATNYTEYTGNNTNLLSCVQQSINYMAQPCFAGSRSASEAGLDVGGLSVCVYYSRDYLDNDGSCRTNYINTVFDGVETCRWQGLNNNEVAAYQLHRVTGYETTVIR